MWNSLTTIVASGFDSNGYLKAINSPVSIAQGHFTQFATPSLASIERAEFNIGKIATHLDAGGASVTGEGVGLYPVFKLAGGHSGPSTAIGGGLVVPRATTLKWASVVVNDVVSTASLVIDINKNLSSIFDAGTRMSIANGGTYVSTASINIQNLDNGDILTSDVDAFGGTDGFARDITVQLGGF